MAKSPDLVDAEPGHLCSCGAPAVVCDLDLDAVEDFYCPGCFHEYQNHDGAEEYELLEMSDGWHVVVRRS